MSDGGASDDEDAGGGSTKKGKKEVRIDPVHDILIDIIFQNKTDALFNGVVDFSSLNSRNTVGKLIALLLDRLGFAWSKSGKKLTDFNKALAGDEAKAALSKLRTEVEAWAGTFSMPGH